jgi:hypothetical protein
VQGVIPIRSVNDVAFKKGIYIPAFNSAKAMEGRIILFEALFKKNYPSWNSQPNRRAGD